MASYWPTSTEPLAAPMNAIPKIVFSSSDGPTYEPTIALQNATDAQREPGIRLSKGAVAWDDTRMLSGDLSTQIKGVKAQPGKDLLAHGGASFAQSLVRLGLVDEYRLLVHPVVPGTGLALFDGVSPFDLTLAGDTIFDSGIQALVYHPT